MIKKKKWLSICLVICLIGGIGGAAWYRQKKIEERRMSLVYIPKVEDSTNDFWKALILGTKMAAKEYNADIVEVELKSQFRCNGSDNYLDWLEQVIYNEPVKSSFKEDEFDFKIFDDPQTLYKEKRQYRRTKRTPDCRILLAMVKFSG